MADILHTRVNQTTDIPRPRHPEVSGRDRAAWQVVALTILVFGILSVLYTVAVLTRYWVFLLATNLFSLVALPAALIGAPFLLVLYFTQGSIDTIAFGIRFRGMRGTLTLLAFSVITTAIAIRVLWIDDIAWKAIIHQQLSGSVENHSEPE